MSLNNLVNSQKDYSRFGVVFLLLYGFLLLAPAGILGWFATNLPYESYRETYYVIAGLFFFLTVAVLIDDFLFTNRKFTFSQALQIAILNILTFQIFPLIHEPLIARMPFPSQYEVIPDVRVGQVEITSGRYRICDRYVDLSKPAWEKYCFDKFSGTQLEQGDKLEIVLRRVYIFNYELGYEIDSIKKLAE